MLTFQNWPSLMISSAPSSLRKRSRTGPHPWRWRTGRILLTSSRRKTRVRRRARRGEGMEAAISRAASGLGPRRRFPGGVMPGAEAAVPSRRWAWGLNCEAAVLGQRRAWGEAAVPRGARHRAVLGGGSRMDHEPWEAPRQEWGGWARCGIGSDEVWVNGLSN
jgi:hypothetical protein